MKKVCGIILSILILCTMVSVSFADNADDFLNNARKYNKSKQYSKALEEIDWARKEIQMQVLSSLQELLPDKIKGYEKEAYERGTMFGMLTTGARYIPKDKADAVLEVTIVMPESTTLSKGIGALLNFAQMTSDLGVQATKIVVSHGKRGTLITNLQTQESTLLFNLDNKMVVTLKAVGKDSEKVVADVAKQVDLSRIEGSM